jgi:predicted ATP-dependent endonuclease of OLD family
MRISKLSVKNFRLLADVTLQLEERTTVIVGRNNSGKTSLTELFRRLLSDKASAFRLEDFSLSAHDDFWLAYGLKRNGSGAEKIREMLPSIDVTLTISYADNNSGLGLLTDFIVDLNAQCTDALVVLRYQLKDGDLDAFFENLGIDEKMAEGEQKSIFYRAMRERVPKHYLCVMLAVDPNDAENRKPVDPRRLHSLIQGGFINAQRGIDDTTHKDINMLGKVLETLLTSAMSSGADANDRDVAQNLESAVQEIQSGIDTGFNKQLQDLLPAFTLFGYPGLSDPRLLTETTLDVQRLLKNHTKVHYAGINGINLPEAYNGLGVRNLIFILLKLYEFFKLFKAADVAPGVHLIFIEEPEVHLHPQMQEVFIAKLGAIAEVFSTKFNAGNPWPVQFVVTTHSSHLANKADFEAMRYFSATSDAHSDNLRSTEIKDLRQGLGGTPKGDREFLHKYMTLTRSDLLFADKAVLIEGTTERLLLPKMIAKLDGEKPNGPHLSSQYVSVVEVGGAYAHLFFGLLDFLQLQTLILTDLDSVNEADGGKTCKVSEGTRTSNACLKDWFGDPKITPVALMGKPNEEKIHKLRRLAYQVPESGEAPCGRSFEDAFILANGTMFGLTAADASTRETQAWEQAKGVGKKSDFALEYAINKTDWVVPRYIAEGLRWLTDGSSSSPLLDAKHGGITAATPLRKKKDA